MNILFISSEGNCYPLAMEMVKQGNDCRFWVKNTDESGVEGGGVVLVKSYKDSVDWAELVISDDTCFGKILDGIREKGIPCVGGTALTDALEEDRGLGQRLFKAVGMETLDSEEFTSIPEAIAYVKKNPRAYVIKVSGKAQDDKTFTYVGETPDGMDIPPVLQHYEKRMAEGIESVEIQEKVQGIEVAVGGFFNGEDFLNPVCFNFEHKKLMPGPTASGTGPATGEMGTVHVWKDKGFVLYKETLERCIPMLKKEGYRGYFDINLIIVQELGVPGDSASDGFCIYPLEMTNRFGWPTLQIQLETMKINNLAEVFHGMASGNATDFGVSHIYSVGVVVGAPPLPYLNHELFEKYSEGMPVIFRDGYPPEGVIPGDIKEEDGQWTISGPKGYVCVCVGQSDDLEGARSAAYHLVDQVIVPNRMVRFDIGEHIPWQISSMKPLLEVAKEENEVYT